MKLLILCLIFAVSSNALKSTSKLKDGFDSIYSYTQNLTVFIDSAETTNSVTSFELIVRQSAESVTGQLRVVDPTNLTDTLLSEITSPFKIHLGPDGVPSEIWTKSNESFHALRVKSSIMKLLLQNATEIGDYIESNSTSITDDKCQDVTTVTQTDDEYIFKTDTKSLDCNGVEVLKGVASDETKFKVIYRLSKSDKGLSRAKSIINVVYLTSVAARFKTIQTLEFVRFDGLQAGIDDAVLVEKHTFEEIEKNF